jgi:hypothetical protein
MKDYIERYIYAVTKRLPEKNREEVKEELKANIYDMLPKHPTEADIEKVLMNLGSPRKLAFNYQEKKNYVISPLYFNDYINVLKIVFIIVIAVMAVTGSIEAVVNLEATNIFLQILEVFFKVLSNVISGLFTAFAWVTLIFWIVDYSMTANCKDEWKMKDLPEIPKPTGTKISKGETIVGLILTVTFSALFIAVLMNYLEYIVISNDQGFYVTEIFNQSVAKQFVPYFIISAVFGVMVYILKLYVGEWKINIAILHTAYELLSTSLALIFINNSRRILPAVFESIASYTDFTLDQVLSGFSKGVTALSVIICVLLAIELSTTWYKTLKGKKVKA